MNLFKAIIMTVCALSIALYAQTPAATAKPAAHHAKMMKKEILTGTIIDNHCAAANKDTLGAFIKTHTKDCVLAPACKESGFSLYTTGGKLMPFVKASDSRILTFLENPKSKLNVEVNAEQMGDSLKLMSIKDQMAAK